MLKGFLIGLQFFTSIPIKKQMPMTDEYINKCLQTLPLIGLFQGVLYSGLLYVLLEWSPFSFLAIAFFLWLFAILFTGGLHLDGWIDTSDAFFSYQDKTKRLEIMGDPRTGAFGILSVLVLLSSRFLFMYEIFQKVQPLTFLLILCIPFFSKMVISGVLFTVPAAKKEGLAYFFQQAIIRKAWYIYIVYLLIFVSISLYIAPQALMLVSLLLCVALICFLWIRKKAVQWFGGITGDVLGATGEGMENFLWMTLWLLHYFVMG